MMTKAFKVERRGRKAKPGKRYPSGDLVQQREVMEARVIAFPKGMIRKRLGRLESSILSGALQMCSTRQEFTMGATFAVTGRIIWLTFPIRARRQSPDSCSRPIQAGGEKSTLPTSRRSMNQQSRRSWALAREPLKRSLEWRYLASDVPLDWNTT
jgi:hypothetical protein